MKWCLASLALLALGLMAAGCSGELGSVDGTSQLPARATFLVNGQVIGTDTGGGAVTMDVAGGPTTINVQGTNVSVQNATSSNTGVARASFTPNTVTIVPVTVGQATINITLQVPSRTRQLTTETVSILVTVTHSQTHGQGSGTTN